MQHYFILGPLAGTPHTRYAVLHGEHTVWEVLISRPDGAEIDRPAHLRWRHLDLAGHLAQIQVRRYRINETPVNPAHNGEQPRRPTWRRAGRTAAKE